MKQDCIPVIKPTIEEIQEQFIAWRNNRRCRGPVPEALWEAAVSLSEDYSVGQISKGLRLNYRELKRRIQSRRSNGYQEEGRSCHFVELAVSEPKSDTEYVMEMEDQKGGKLKVYIKGGGGGGSFNLLEMAKAFWERDK